MKYAVVIVGIFLAFSIVGVLVYRFLNSGDEEFGGFRDWVKSKDYKQAASDFFDAREALTVPDDISDREIQQMVDRLFVRKDTDFNLERLKLVGVKAVPMLIAALENPKTASTKFGDGGHPLDATSPFERIVDLLESIGPADAALPLAKYIDHDDDGFRKHAAIALGNIGSSDCIAPMLKALDDDDDYVRSYAMMGIQNGIQAKRCSKDFLDAMFPALTKLLNRHDQSINGGAPDLLLAIDIDRGMAALLSPEHFNVENNQVHYIIRSLNAAAHKIPHETLLPFLNTVKPLADEYPHDYDYAEAIMAYAHNPDAAAEQMFRTELKSSNKKIQTAAAQALAILSGVANARKIVFDALKNRGFDQLSAAQQHYYAVFIYDAEVNNGGHSQFFVNSSGDHWKFAIEGLNAIGATARANILHEATNLFGAAGPSVENDRRHRQLAAFSDLQDKSLSELDSKYYSCDENIEALLTQYAIKNKEHFVAQE